MEGLSALDALVRSASGPLGLLVVFVFSFLCAVALPLPSELVLLAPINLGLPGWGDLAVLVVVASAGKAAGGVVALKVSRRAASTNRFAAITGRFRFGPVVAVEAAIGGVVRRYGVLGLVTTLSIPGAPDTAAIYAFSVGHDDPVEFAAAAFVGTVVRLLIVAGLAAGVLAVLPTDWL